MSQTGLPVAYTCNCAWTPIPISQQIDQPISDGNNFVTRQPDAIHEKSSQHPSELGSVFGARPGGVWGRVPSWLHSHSFPDIPRRWAATDQSLSDMRMWPSSSVRLNDAAVVPVVPAVQFVAQRRDTQGDDPELCQPSALAGDGDARPVARGDIPTHPRFGRQIGWGKWGQWQTRLAV
jgi:hypothetical protein